MTKKKPGKQSEYAERMYEVIAAHPDGITPQELRQKLGFHNKQKVYNIAVSCEGAGLLIGQHEGKWYKFPFEGLEI